MFVHEIMTKEPVCIEVTCSIREAIHQLMQLDVRHLPVLERGRLVGFLSDRDLRAISATAFELEGGVLRQKLDRSVKDLMANDVLTVEPDSDVGEIIDLMIDNKIGALPVVDPNEDRLVGIVSYVDVLRAAQRYFV